MDPMGEEYNFIPGVRFPAFAMFLPQGAGLTSTGGSTTGGTPTTLTTTGASTTGVWMVSLVGDGHQPNSVGV